MQLTRSLLSSLLLASLSVGCADFADEPAADSYGGKADELSDGAFVVTIAQAGAFNENYNDFRVQSVHYGFTDSKSPGWESAGDLTVEYNEEGYSLPVEVEVPEGTEGYLAFVLQGKHRYETVWNEDQYISLARPAGAMVHLALRNFAGYPFSPECYGISVFDLNAGTRWSNYDGRVSEVLYGFTSATADEYKANNDVDWLDGDDNEGHEGVLHPITRHDGGYKGTYRMLEEFVRVPAGLGVGNRIRIVGTRDAGRRAPMSHRDLPCCRRPTSGTRPR